MKEENGKMKKTTLGMPVLMVAVLAMLLAGCGENDFTQPSFLHVGAIDLVPSTQNVITTEAGFYTSDIVASYVVAHYPGEMKVDTLGLFLLPFTIPVLHSGAVDYLDFYPAVEQSGQSMQLPFYTFYHRIRISDTTLTSGDTLRLDTLTTTYNITRNDVLMYEMFEPTEGSLLFDSVMGWRPHAPDEACSGYGYGVVEVADSVTTVRFDIDRDFYVTDPTKLIYLEMDVKSELDMEVFMISSYISGANTERYSVMHIRPCAQWEHLYINMGRTWSYFNHNPAFRISFSAYNFDGTGGEVRIDNVRLLTTSVVL